MKIMFVSIEFSRIHSKIVLICWTYMYLNVTWEYSIFNNLEVRHVDTMTLQFTKRLFEFPRTIKSYYKVNHYNGNRATSFKVQKNLNILTITRRKAQFTSYHYKFVARLLVRLVWYTKKIGIIAIASKSEAQSLQHITKDILFHCRLHINLDKLGWIMPMVHNSNREFHRLLQNFMQWPLWWSSFHYVFYARTKCM